VSPDVEWQIGDGVDEETVVKTPARARHWRNDLIALTGLLGAGLGLIYSSVQEPPAPPTPAPISRPSPPPTPGADRNYENVLSLGKTIGVEAQALAEGDLKIFLALQDPLDAFWFRDQQNNFQAWGRLPADDPHFSRLYFYVETISQAPPRDRAAVDIRQYRHGQYFRETRFYRLQNDQWLRTRPDLSFWSGPIAFTRTPHFDVTYPIEDEALMSIVTDRFEAAYRQLCAELNCPDKFPSALAEPTIHLLFDPNINRVTSDAASPMTITLPSPRVLGLYETDVERARQLDDPVLRAASESLIQPLIVLLSGGVDRWDHTGQGWFLLQAVGTWESNRISAQPDMLPLLPPAQLSNNIPLIKLESLWTLQNVPSNPEQVANSVIFFIEQKYGVEGVSKFLKAIGPADSWAEVITNSLDMNEIQFEQQWKDWLKQVYAQGS
jgi:hypothetical protein